MSAALLGLALLAAATPEPAADSWNGAQIPWRSYEAGLAEAKAANKPVCLVFHATWCSGCKAYKKLFFEPKVVKLTRDFVMVLVDRDQAPELSAKYDLDGEYIPRTLFLNPAGELDAEVHALGGEQRYYYDVQRSGPLRRSLRWAKKRMTPKPAKARAEPPTK